MFVTTPSLTQNDHKRLLNHFLLPEHFHSWLRSRQAVDGANCYIFGAEISSDGKSLQREEELRAVCDDQSCIFAERSAVVDLYVSMRHGVIGLSRL
jgi:hypothetical protein